MASSNSRKRAMVLYDLPSFNADDAAICEELKTPEGAGISECDLYDVSSARDGHQHQYNSGSHDSTAVAATVATTSQASPCVTTKLNMDLMNLGIMLPVLEERKSSVPQSLHTSDSIASPKTPKNNTTILNIDLKTNRAAANAQRRPAQLTSLSPLVHYHPSDAFVDFCSQSLPFQPRAFGPSWSLSAATGPDLRDRTSSSDRAQQRRQHQQARRNSLPLRNSTIVPDNLCLPQIDGENQSIPFLLPRPKRMRSCSVEEEHHPRRLDLMMDF